MICFLIGGINEELGDLKTTEFVRKDKIIETGPTLPESRSYHCMVTINSSSSVIIGGLVSGSMSNSVLVYDTIDFSHKIGPSMLYARYAHACGIFNSNYLKYDILN